MWYNQVKPLTTAQVGSCRVLPSREAMLEILPRGGTVAEIGVHKAVWSRAILEVNQPQRLYLVDRRAWPPIADNRVVALRGDSASMIEKYFLDSSFDWIYIDADHSYEGVKRDALAAIPKLKPDGLLIFNDYIMYDYMGHVPYGVVQLVNELCHTGWHMIYLALNWNLFVDVALRRDVA